MWAKVTVAYDGSNFYGSQHLRRHNETIFPTVLSVFEGALRSMGIFSKAYCAGRTDRFVHANGQVIGFLLPDFWCGKDRLKNELDKKLYPLILIKKVEIMGDDFHPRFSARSRVYRYLITTERPPVFTARLITYAPFFDARKAKEAIELFEGTHDFYHFSKRGSDEKTTVRSIYKTALYAYKNIHIARFEGNGFLRSQVRMMMGAVLKVASNGAASKDINDQLNGEKVLFRSPAPPNGLYLCRVNY
ncbi:MAG: tRNA pseudouridine(38-40) synthase TruA [Helicobacteraceae bacterium]|jgi:tRNA pseudouridine38-40 synthase|nr:tRNA pseudouridine(38-40) synthase TruA [Helicobacteraceae bacterium]